MAGLAQPIGLIVADAAAAFGVSPRELLSYRRSPALLKARFAAAWAAREGTWRSWPEIGRALRRDHSTVIHNSRRAAQLREANAGFAAATDRLLAAARERNG